MTSQKTKPQKLGIGNKQLINQLKRGGVGVLPTDTLYGLVGSALMPAVVEKIYKLKQRSSKKPLIILISDINQLKKFGIPAKTIETAASYWPGPISLVLKCSLSQFSYLHRGTDSIAFRIPKPNWLRGLLRAAGPLVAPSANPEGKLPATSITEAEHYFSGNVDFYVDGGKLSRKPSQIISLVDVKAVKIRD